MATVNLVSADGSNITKKYIITWTNNVTITPSNLNTQWPIPTVKRAKFSDDVTVSSWPALTRYIHILLPDQSGSQIVFKAVFAENNKTATVTRYNVKTYGALAWTNEVLRVGAPTKGNSTFIIMNTSTTSTDTTYGYLSGSTVSGSITYSGFTPNVNLYYVLSSSLNSSFGYVKGFCTGTLKCDSLIGWTHNSGTIPASVTDSAHVITEIKGNNTSSLPTGTLYGAKTLNATLNLGILNNISTECAATVHYGEFFHQTFSTTITVQDYTSPAITKININRNNNYTNNISVELYYNLSTLNKTALNTNGNTNSITTGSIIIYYKLIPADGSQNITGQYIMCADGSTLSSVSGVCTFDINPVPDNTSYTIDIYIKDRLNVNGNHLYGTVPSAYRTMDVKAGGEGITFGGTAEETGLVSYMPTIFYNDVFFDVNSDDDLYINIPRGYNIDLTSHGSWVDSGTTVDNNILYKSDGSYNVNNAWDTAKVTFWGYCDFILHIRSWAEGYYDYVLVSVLNDNSYYTATSTSDFNDYYKDSSKTKAHTRGNQSTTTYTEVSFSDLNPFTTYYFYIVYKKDGSSHGNDDRGYFYIG